MSSWQHAVVADIAAPVRNALVGGPFGSDLTSRDYVQTGVPVIRGTNLGVGRWVGGDFAYVSGSKADSLSANCASPGDLVFTQRGTLGQVALAPDHGPQRYLISQSQMKLTVNQTKADPLFLYYYFVSAGTQDYIRQHAIQTGVPHINLGILRAMPVPLPPLENQKRIAEALGALDDKIESNRRAVELVLGLLDTIAVREAESLPAVALRSLTSLARSSTNPGALGNALVDHFSLPAFDTSARPEVVPAVAIMSNKTRVTERSILVSRLNPRIDRTWWATPREGIVALASTEFACLTATDDLALAGLWLAVRGQSFREELTRRVTGTSGSHQRVRPEDLLTIEVPNVSQLADEVKARILALLELVDHFRDEAADLAALRDILLPELLSGRIQVAGRAVVKDVVA